MEILIIVGLVIVAAAVMWAANRPAEAVKSVMDINKDGKVDLADAVVLVKETVKKAKTVAAKVKPAPARAPAKKVAAKSAPKKVAAKKPTKVAAKTSAKKSKV